MASQVEVPGKWVFRDGKTCFVFAHGGQEIDFNDIQSVDHLHSVLRAIANVGVRIMMSASLSNTESDSPLAGSIESMLGVFDDAKLQVQQQLEQTQKLFNDERARVAELINRAAT